MNDSTLSTSSGPSPASALAPATDTLQVFSGIAAFDAAQRMAKALCSSTLVPKEYQGQQGLANSLIALEIASRMRLSPLVVMQNMTPIHGRPTWSSKFLIATVNASGRFSPLRFVFDAKEQPTSCYAVATDKATGEVLEGETITLELARKEGWWSRKDRQGNETSKWQTMTGQMLRYRAAAWWSNVYCPEIALGLITQEEALDIEAVTVREAGRASITGAEIQAPAQVAEEPAGPAAAPEKPTARRTAAGSRAAAVPNLLRPREDKMIPPETQNSATGRIEPSHGGNADTQQEVIDAEIVDTSGAAPEPATPAEHQGEQQAGQQAGQQEALSLQASETPAAANQPAPRRSRSQAAAASAPGPAPAQEAAPAPEPELNPVEVGLRQIPHIATLQELDSAYGRVNQLLSAGQINDENAERLWSAITRRRRQLEDSESAQQSAGAGT